MTPANHSTEDIQSKVHDDELNKAEDRIEDHEEETIECHFPHRASRQRTRVPSPKEIVNVFKK